MFFFQLLMGFSMVEGQHHPRPIQSIARGSGRMLHLCSSCRKIPVVTWGSTNLSDNKLLSVRTTLVKTSVVLLCHELLLALGGRWFLYLPICLKGMTAKC